MTFGKIIAKARRNAGLQLKDVAMRVQREDGQTVSHQYLSDIEHDRRPAPSNHLIDQLADALNVPREYLYLHARRLPTDFDVPDDPQIATTAFRAFRENLTQAA